MENIQLSNEEQQMIQKGKNHWNLDVLNKKRGGYVYSVTIKELIDNVIENTWIQAKSFYEKKIKKTITLTSVI